MSSKAECVMVLGIGIAAATMYYAVYIATWLREGELPEFFWAHVLNQALFGGFLGGAISLLRQLLKG